MTRRAERELQQPDQIVRAPVDPTRRQMLVALDEVLSGQHTGASCAGCFPAPPQKPRWQTIQAAAARSARNLFNVASSRLYPRSTSTLIKTAAVGSTDAHR